MAKATDPTAAYVRAVRRIQDAAVENATQLDLSGLGLETLPPEIRSLTALQTLNLRSNTLIALPPEIGSLTKLQTLNLYNNQLTTLPPEIGSLTALNRLELFDNRLTMLPPEIQSLSALQTLDLDGNQLTTLPPEIGSLTALNRLELQNNQLTTLPPEIGSLIALQELVLFNNQLTALPPEIGSLTALQTLNLHRNQLTTLPPEIGSLTALDRLDVSSNKLTALPPKIGSLTALQTLNLGYNQLTTLPPEIGSLTALQTLILERNQLTTLPPEIGSLTKLRELALEENQLTTLPREIGTKLAALRVLAVKGNPLPGELLALSGGRTGRGTKLFKYLREVAKGPGKSNALKRFDEAKLLLLGAGDAGKTWLLRALQGKRPTRQGPTKGIEIAREPLDVAHPADPKRVLHFNCWDFGGQDYFQITHQIFFGAKSVYLLVWKPRVGFDPVMIERLERIKLSAGRTAKVLVVSTHADPASEDHVPAVIGKEMLRQRFGDLIWGFHEVDSEKGETGQGIAELKADIARAAAQLEGLDLVFSKHWHAARAAVLAAGKKTLKFSEFAGLCEAHKLDRGESLSLTAIMEVQGRAVFFAEAADEEGLGLQDDNLVVLDPEWVAKAIGSVIEDEKTIQETGFLDHARLKAVWKARDERGGEVYPHDLHGYLLWLMWRFNIAYPLDADSSLVPQLIDRVCPDGLLWTPDKPPSGRHAVLIGVMPQDPPVGLIAGLTAAVHPHRRRRAPGADRWDRNWKEGFFLDTERKGSAFVEMPDRKLRIEVRSDYPSVLMDEVVRTLEILTKERWRQLEVDYRVPCTTKGCSELHKKSWLDGKRGRTFSCQGCNADISVDALLDGFDPQYASVMEKLRELKEGQQQLSAAQTELLAVTHAILLASDPDNSERSRAPGLLSIIPGKSKWYQRATHDAVGITCWCEHPDGPHPASPVGSEDPPDYLLTMPKGWLVKARPYISWATLLFKAFVPLTGTLLTQTNDDPLLKEQVATMNDVAKALPSGELELDEASLNADHNVRPEIIALRHIHDLMLDKIRPESRWGELKLVQTKSGQLLWLCPQHAAIQQRPIQPIS